MYGDIFRMMIDAILANDLLLNFKKDELTPTSLRELLVDLEGITFDEEFGRLSDSITECPEGLIKAYTEAERHMSKINRKFIKTYGI